VKGRAENCGIRGARGVIDGRTRKKEELKNRGDTNKFVGRG